MFFCRMKWNSVVQAGQTHLFMVPGTVATIDNDQGGLKHRKQGRKIRYNIVNQHQDVSLYTGSILLVIRGPFPEYHDLAVLEYKITHLNPCCIHALVSPDQLIRFSGHGISQDKRR